MENRFKKKEWQETMDKSEIDWCFDQINKKIRRGKGIFYNTDNYRAARVWISSQKRRFFKQANDGC